MVIDYLRKEYDLTDEMVKMIEDLRKLYENMSPKGFEAIVNYVEYVLGFNFRTKPPKYVSKQQIELTEKQRKALIYVYNRVLLSEATLNLDRINYFIEIQEHPQRLLDSGVNQRMIDNVVSWKYASSPNSPNSVSKYTQLCTWQILLALMFYMMIIPNCYSKLSYSKEINIDAIVDRLVALNFDDQLIYEDASKNSGKLYAILFDMSVCDIIRYIWGR